MFPINLGGSVLAGRPSSRALDAWRAAEDLVAVRWATFLDAEPETRQWAYASYLAALDAEEAAALDMAWAAARQAA